MRRDGRDTYARHRTGEQMSTKLRSITQRARENSKGQFVSLAHLLSQDFLKECFGELKRDKSPGIDGVTVKAYEVNLEENLRDLAERMKAKRYRPLPVKRAYISKLDGTKRPLGIPAVEDKIVQSGVKRILESIFEVDFIDVSYGFRPNRNCHEAVNTLDKTIMTKPVNYVVDMDIEKFFDTINHQWLMKCLRPRVKDRSLLILIGRFLKAGVIEEGKYLETDKGTSQGGILSPLLANIYLHYIIDLWFEKKIKKGLKGFSQLTRYADDFVVCFQYEKEAKEFSNELRERLNKFGLKLAANKSRVIEFGRYALENTKRKGKKRETFNFLGFTFYCAKSRSGKFWVRRKTARAKFIQKVKAVNQWLKGIRNSMELKEWWKMLTPKLLGHFRYYGIAGNKLAITEFRDITVKLAYKWINRRSQKKSYNWEQFKRFLKYNPLPIPKIYHPFPSRQLEMCY